MGWGRVAGAGTSKFRSFQTVVCGDMMWAMGEGVGALKAKCYRQV